MKNILLTGVSGRVGRAFYESAKGRYRMTLCDLWAPDFELAEDDRIEIADLTDAAASGPLVAEHDTMVHLAGIPDPDAAFADLLPANILVTTHLIEAAVTAGCHRFVYASSAQTIEGYPLDRQIPDGAAPRPANMYGVSKS